MAEDVHELFKTSVPEQVVVLARGPSLGLYDRANHPDATVFGVNHLGYFPEYAADFAVVLDTPHFDARGMETVGIPITSLLVTKRRKQWPNGYFWRYPFPGEDNQKFDAMRITGSVAIAIPFWWGCRDIWVYGMDAYPDADTTESFFEELATPDNYRLTVQMQKRMFQNYPEMEACVKFAHLEDVPNVAADRNSLQRASA